MMALLMFLKQPNFIFLCAFICLATLNVANAGNGVALRKIRTPVGPDIVGGKGGVEFSFKSNIDNTLREITITYNEEEKERWFYSVYLVTSLNTIQVIFQNKETFQAGRVKGSNEKHIYFDYTDKIVAATLWPNQRNDRLGGLEFVVQKQNGEIKTMSLKSAYLGDPVNVDVESGRCYGVKGRSGDEIDALGFYFKPAAS